MEKGLVVILSAPSGTGKSTVCRKLLGLRKDLRYSVTCTTRPPRKGEVDGRDYFFLSPGRFKDKLQRGDLLEWAFVHGERYGTPRMFVDRSVMRGLDVILAIDTQGARSVKRKIKDAVRIFLLPPSMRALRTRLRGRREAPDSMHGRLADARAELAAAKDYDYLVVNDDLKKAVSQVSSIMTAERLRSARRRGRDLDPLVK